MGIKSNYFRHSFTAHTDIKLQQLIRLKSVKAYAIYFVLLEFYCAKLRDDDEDNLEQEIDLKHLASCLGVRSDFVRSCIIVMEQLELTLHLSFNYDQTMVKLSIPKSLKYFGRYGKVSEAKIPNKIKENKRKEKKRVKALSAPNPPTPNAEREQFELIPQPSALQGEELLDRVMAAWNVMAKQFGLKPILKANPARSIAFRKACKEIKTYEEWTRLINQVPKDAFRTGTNNRGWKSNWDYLFTKNHALDLLEEAEVKELDTEVNWDEEVEVNWDEEK